MIKNKIAIALRVFAFVGLFSHSAEANIRVGNCGTGCRTEQGLKLYEFATSSYPTGTYFGEEVDQRYVEALEKTPGLMFVSFDRTLLSRKLVDLDQVVPGLGEAALHVLMKYELMDLADAVITLLPSAPLSQSGCVQEQIATRYTPHILLATDRFNELSGDDKIGLLLHEAFFALLNPDCATSQRCVQKVEKVHSFIREAFSREGLDRLKRDSKIWMADYSLPQTLDHSGHVMTIGLPSGKTVKGTVRAPDNSKEILNFVSRVCLELEGSEPESRFWQVDFEAAKLTLDAVFDTYPAPRFEDPRRIKVESTKTSTFSSKARLSSERCEADLLRLILFSKPE